MSSLRSAILLISTEPVNWRPEKASSLGGVIIVPHCVTPEDLEVLRNRHLPHIIFTESELPGPHISLGQRQAARHMTEELLRLGHRRFALLCGYDPMLDETKRRGFHDALKEAGIDHLQVPEISYQGDESIVSKTAQQVLDLRPRPTAVLATDDSLGSALVFQARQSGVRVPEELSVVSFHDRPYLNYTEPTLTTVRFDFFGAGQRAAEALSSAALTGDPVNDIALEPTYRAGQSIGPAPGA